MALSAGKVTERLCDSAAMGAEARFGTADEAVVPNDLIRRLALRLALDGRDKPCAITPFGIRIVGARVDGRVDLDNAVPDDGASICPIEFEGCTLDGGFSGRNAHFSRLSFRDCLFRDPPPDHRQPPAEAKTPRKSELEPQPLASIELSGAGLSCDLDLSGARPDGDSTTGSDADKDYLDERGPHQGEQHFWVRLRGARIDGNLDLSRVRLRVPPGTPSLLSEPQIAALNLTQAEIHGDFIFVNGSRARGRVLAREACIRGDIWMSGAKLNGMGEGALLLQSATVEGMIVLDGRHDRRGATGAYRYFEARGEINCMDLRLRGDLTLRNARLSPSLPTTPVGLRAPNRPICLRLQGATVQGSVEISGSSGSTLRGRIDLTHLEVGKRVLLSNLELGIDALRNDRAMTVDARSMEAKQLWLAGLRPLDGRPALSIDLSNSKLGEIKVTDCSIDGSLKGAPLDCKGDLSIDARIGGKLDLAGATVGGSMDLSRLRLSRGAAGISLRDATITRALRLQRHSRPVAPSPQAARSGPRLRGTVDLTDLSCDTLEDGGGLLWGRRVHIDMNHFVYRQGSWTRDPGDDGRKIWTMLLRWRGSLKHRKPWEIRRDWIYQQYSARDPRRPATYAIEEHEYNPQPFEQAINVARAEGHDEYAAEFEMRKRHVEWGLFNKRNRWTLGYAAITVACLWLWVRRDLDPVVGMNLLAGWGAVMLLMYLIPSIWRWLGRRTPRQVKAFVLAIGFATIVTVIFFRGGWETRPLEYAIAAGIFASIRLVSWLSHAAMRFMFGYLRRPLRAIGSLIVAFLVGWAGVAVANDRRMLVIDVEPVANFTLEDERTKVIHIGSQSVSGPAVFVRNVHCGDTIRPALYALDVLIPLIDLRQESRCEVGRAGAVVRVPGASVATIPVQGPAALEQARRRAEEIRLAERKAKAAERERRAQALAEARSKPIHARMAAAFKALGIEIAALPDSEGFWEVLKALYAIAGWFIVSLSILTFAQVNRARGELG